MKGCAVLIQSYAFFKIFASLHIRTINITPLHASCHKSLIGIFNNRSQSSFCRFFVLHHELFPPEDTPVHCWPRSRINLDNSVTDNQIIADYYTYVIYFQTLTCVNTPYFIDWRRINNPFWSVSFKIPFHSKIIFRNDNIVCIRIFVAYPIPAITCHQSCFVVDLVFFENDIAQFGCRVINSEIVIGPAKIIIGCFTYTKNIVKPCQISICTITSELWT